MPGSALYNEIEPYAAEWIANLVEAGHIARGSVDTRSIVELQPDDVRGHRQVHYFAGIAVWSHALRLAGWPDDIEVWTGSCPCQPLSQAGRKRGFADERHLWPEWFRLIRECRPAIVFGEQVASPLGLEWLDAVQRDLEGAGYACWACDLAAASCGAPHIRQRLYWVAVRGDVLERCLARVGGASGPVGDARVARSGRDARAVPRAQGEGAGERVAAGRVADIAVAAGAARAARGLGHACVTRPGHAQDAGADRGDARTRAEADDWWSAWHLEPERAGAARAPAYAELHDGAGRLAEPHGRTAEQPDRHGDAGGPVGGFWRDAEWIPCRDGKLRPIERRTVESRTAKMVDGSAAWLERVRAAGPLVEWKALPDPKPSRGGMLKAYGNAIVGPLAAEFIASVMEALGIERKEPT